MAAFSKLTAIAAPYEPINVDTDRIIPARFLKYPRNEGYGKFLFHDIRRNGAAEDPAFVLNRAPYDRAKILVANTNFACGSSREGAVYALYDSGFRAVIAPSFGDIFFNNCMKNGVVPARLSPETCAALRAALTARPGTELTVDLESSVVVGADGARHPFTIDAFFRELLLKGTDEVGLTLGLMQEIEAFEQRRYAEAPWIAG